MARPLLPPRGVNVPTRMIYNPLLPPALLQTWIQLRGLAWGGTVTPPFRMQELVALTGKSQATIYQHMSQLRLISALSWRSTGLGTFIVTFAEQPSKTGKKIKISPDILESQILESQNLSPQPPSSTPHSSPDSLCIHNSKTNTDSEIQGKNHLAMDLPEAGGEGVCEGERGSADLRKYPTGLATDPVSAYRSLVHLTPNASKRRILSNLITDQAMWQDTLEHWISHGWNPRNLTGMIELYNRGGASGCRFCPRPLSPRRASETPLEHSLAAIEALRSKKSPTIQQE